MTPGERFVRAAIDLGALIFAAVCILTLVSPVIGFAVWLYFQATN